MNQPTQKIIFVRDTQPLVNCDVRLSGDTDSSWTTDAEGRLDVMLEPGMHTVEVFSDDQWVSQEINVNDSRSSLLVVQLNVRDTLINSPGSPHNTQPFAAQFEALEGRYDVEGIIGRGGMGVVVKAYDKTLERHVAMKMLSESLRDNEEAQRIFLVEARQVAKLRHPNLVGVHDVTSIDGVALMVFEFVDGKEVEQVLKEQGPLSEEQVRNISHQLGNALEYLHNQGVIHRDIKPSNMMIKEDGTLKIIDFGLARSLEQIAVRGTQVRGTPAYMAPEQIEGKHLGYATDLYQAGVSLFELLTGRLPFEEEGITYAHLFKDAPPIEEFLPDISPDIAQLINMCLRKDPLTRPASAGSLAALGTPAPALTLDGLPGVAPNYDPTAAIAVPAQPSEQPITPPAKSNARLGLALVTIAGLILISVGVIFALIKTSDPVVDPNPVVAVNTPEASAKDPQLTTTPVAPTPTTIDDDARTKADVAISTAKRISAAQRASQDGKTEVTEPPSALTTGVPKQAKSPVATKNTDRGAKKPVARVTPRASGSKQPGEESSSAGSDVKSAQKPVPPGVESPAVPAVPEPVRPEPRPVPDPLLVVKPGTATPVLTKSGIATTKTKRRDTRLDPVPRIKVVPKIKRPKAPPRSF